MLLNLSKNVKVDQSKLIAYINFNKNFKLSRGEKIVLDEKKLLTIARNYFYNLPQEIIALIFVYLLPEEIGKLSRVNKLFNIVIKEKIFFYKKIIHFSPLGATANDGKTFIDWYCKSYIKSCHSSNFKSLNLSQRKLFSKVKEGVITDDSIKNMHLKDSYGYSLKEWFVIKKIPMKNLKFNAEELIDIFKRIIEHNHILLFDEFLMYVNDLTIFTNGLASWKRQKNILAYLAIPESVELVPENNLLFLAASRNFELIKKMADININLEYVQPNEGINIFHFAAQSLNREEFASLIKLISEKKSLSSMGVAQPQNSSVALYDLPDNIIGQYPVHYAAAAFNWKLLEHFQEPDQLNQLTARQPFLTPLAKATINFSNNFQKFDKEFLLYERAFNSLKFLIMHSNWADRNISDYRADILHVCALNYDYIFKKSKIFSSNNLPRIRHYLEKSEQLILNLLEKMGELNQREKIALEPLYLTPLAYHLNIKHHIPLAGFAPCTSRLLISIILVTYFVILISIPALLFWAGVRMSKNNSYDIGGILLKCLALGIMDGTLYTFCKTYDKLVLKIFANPHTYHNCILPFTQRLAHMFSSRLQFSANSPNRHYVSLVKNDIGTGELLNLEEEMLDMNNNYFISDEAQEKILLISSEEDAKFEEIKVIDTEITPNDYLHDGRLIGEPLEATNLASNASAHSPNSRNFYENSSSYSPLLYRQTPLLSYSNQDSEQPKEYYNFYLHQ